MSFNRTIYDDCAYALRLNDNQSTLYYNLDANKHYNNNQKRINFGIIGGNDVSQSTENLVDLESDLRNQTRANSRCPSRKYLPTCDVNRCGNVNGYPCGDLRCQPKMYHMKETSMIDYRPRYNNIGYSLKGLGSCPYNPTMFANDPAGFVSGRPTPNANNAFRFAERPYGNKLLYKRL